MGNAMRVVGRPMKASQAFERTLPVLNGQNRYFWTSGESGRLQILRCAACRHWVHPAGPVCPRCLARDAKPEAVSGLGTIATFTVNHQPWRPGVPVPFVIAIVELDEQPGLRLTTNIVGCEPDDVRVGQRVRVCFERHEDVYLPLFELV